MIGIMRSNGDVINVTVITSYGKDYRNSVTSHAVENGSKISDHVQTENLSISIRGVVADADITGYTTVYSAPEVLEQNTAFRVVSSTQPSVQTGGEAVRDALLAAFKNKELVSVLEGMPSPQGSSVARKNTLSYHSDCVITNLSFAEDSDTGDAVEFSLTLEQIRRVKLREVVVNAPKQSVGKGTKGTNKGNKKPDKKPATNVPAQAAPVENKGRGVSIARQRAGDAIEFVMEGIKGITSSP